MIQIVDAYHSIVWVTPSNDGYNYEYFELVEYRHIKL